MYLVEKKQQLLKCILCTAVLLFQSFSMAQDEEYLADENAKKTGSSSSTNFFGEGQGKQDFFVGRNLSSNSVFTPSNSNLNLAPIIKSPAVTNTDIQANDQTIKTTDSFVADTNKENPGSEDRQSSPPSEDQADSNSQTVLSSNSDSNIDPSLRDVMEHSKKIREAIFGEEAAKKLPASIRQRLQDKLPQAKEQGTRF